MRRDQEWTKKLPRGWNVPSLAEQEYIGPESPSGRLRGDEQRVLRGQAKSVTQCCREKRIGREKGRVRYLHHFVSDGWDNRVVSAVDDLGEPIAVVLHERLVAVLERPFRREQHDRQHKLQQRHGQAAGKRTRCGRKAKG